VLAINLNGTINNHLMRTIEKIIIVSVFIILLFSGCQKINMCDCFKSTGKPTVEHREIPYFEHIILEDNVNIILTQDNECSVKVHAGENIIGSIITEVNNNTLTIRNDNTCDWVRSYNDDIDVYLSVENLVSIVYRAAGDIISTNTIVSDSLNIGVWDGSGSIDLDILTVKSVLSLHYGTVDFHIQGTTEVNYIYASSFGPFYCEDLEANFTFMNNRGSNNCYVNCKTRLEVTIENIGNIYYKGNPEIVANITGTGQLIPLD